MVGSIKLIKEFNMSGALANSSVNFNKKVEKPKKVVPEVEVPKVEEPKVEKPKVNRVTKTKKKKVDTDATK